MRTSRLESNLLLRRRLRKAPMDHLVGIVNTCQGVSEVNSYRLKLESVEFRYELCAALLRNVACNEL